MNFDISAVAFDIDGTLYPSWRFSLKILPFAIKNFKFMLAFNKTRNKIRQYQKENPNIKQEYFFEFQAKILAEYLKTDTETVQKFLEKKIYIGWKHKFKYIKPYPFAKEAIRQLKQRGYKIAVLSDFLPEQKGDIWGILPFCDVSLGSENIGVLKPSKIVFETLAKELSLTPHNILYVGNSFKYDILGAKNAGMYTAYVSSPVSTFFKKLFLHSKEQRADIYFSNYKQLLKSLL